MNGEIDRGRVVCTHTSKALLFVGGAGLRGCIDDNLVGGFY